MLLIYLAFYLVSIRKFLIIDRLRTYECGFRVSDDTRSFFSFRFFFITILFLVFDIEIALILPLPFIIGGEGIWYYILFMWVLVIGLAYEYWYGSLKWL